jgi:predicted permease
MPITLEVGVDPRVLGFALLLSLGTGVVFSLLPALRSSRPDLAAALKGAGRGRPRGGIRMRSAFVVGQVAMSLVLLVAAGLFLRALERALSIDPGFEPSGVTVAKLDLHRLRYEEPQGRQLYQQILEAVQRVPGVEAASLSAAVPLGPGGEMLGIAPLGAAAAERKGDFIHANVVTPAYFRTMQIPLLRGRGFTDADRESTPRVAVVSLAMAEQLWPGEDPVGQRFRQEFSAMQLMLGGDQEPAEYEVVGVVPDHKTTSLREERAPHLYLPLSQSYRPRVVLAVRTRGDASPAAAAVRAQLRALAPDLPMLEFAPLRDLIGNALLAQRIGATLTTLFGVLGLLLTAIGVYGVMAYAVEQRTREIGIRMALGAQRGSVLALVLRRSVALTALGLAVGFVAALAATRLIASLLYGVSASDPVAFAVGALLLGAVALLASYLPARRATRVDPMVALRDG